MPRLARIAPPLVLLLAGTAAARAGQPAAEAIPPAPSLERVEPAVREAIELRRRAVIEAGAASAAEQARRWGELGVSFHAHDFREAASVCYARAANLEPRSPRWLHLEGLLRFEAGDFAGAADSFGRALALRPESLPTLLRAGEARRRALDLDGAKEAFEAALALDPSAAAAYCGLGAVALQGSRAEEALRAYERCVDLDPAASRVQAILAPLYRRLGQDEQAAAAASRAGPTDVSVPDPYLAAVRAAAAHGDVHLARGSDAYREGRLEAAVAEYERALGRSPGDPRVHRGLGTVYERLGRVAASIRHYRRALELDSEDVLSRFNLASLLAREGRYAAAIPYLEEVLERDPGDREAARNLAWLYTREERLEEAAALYRRMLSRGDAGPETAELRREAVRLLLRLGRPAEATTLLEEAVAAAPDDGASRVLLGGLEAEAGRFDAAAEQLVGALELPLAAEVASRAHYVLGLVRERQGRADDALEHLRESLRLASAPAAPALELARLLAIVGRCDEAQEILHQVPAGAAAAMPLEQVTGIVERCTGGAAPRGGPPPRARR